MISTLQEVRDWLSLREETRLNVDNVDRPSTKWAFVLFINVQVSVILDRQPLMGTGPLPHCLRQKEGLVAVDTYNDNFCLWRYLALHLEK